MVAPIALMAIFNFGTAEAQRWLAAEYAEHRAQLAALARRAAGPTARRPQDRRARRAARIREKAKRVRRYWELQAWLVSRPRKR